MIPDLSEGGMSIQRRLLKCGKIAEDFRNKLHHAGELQKLTHGEKMMVAAMMLSLLSAEIPNADRSVMVRMCETSINTALDMTIKKRK